MGTVHTNGTVVIQAYVTGGRGGAPAVDLLVDGAPLAAMVPPYSMAWNTAAMSEGPHSVTARAVLDGVSVTSAALNVVVDRTPPHIVDRYPPILDTNADVRRAVRVVFSEPVLPASVGDGELALSGDSIPHTKTLTLAADGVTLDATPDVLPVAEEVWSAALGDRITDLAGNALSAAEPSWSWTYPVWRTLAHHPDAVTLTVREHLGTLSTGGLYAAFIDGTNQHIHVLTQLDGAVQEDVLTGTFAAITAGAGPNGTLHIVSVWANASEHIVWNAGQFTRTPIAIPTHTNSPAGFAFDLQGNMVAAWRGSDTAMRVYRQAGTVWQQVGPDLVDPTGEATVGAPSVAVDPTGAPVVAWSQNDGSFPHARVARWNGTAWEARSGLDFYVTFSGPAANSSLRITPDGREYFVSASRYTGEHSVAILQRSPQGVLRALGYNDDGLNGQGANNDIPSASLTVGAAGPVVGWVEGGTQSASRYWCYVAEYVTNWRILPPIVDDCSTTTGVALDGQGSLHASVYGFRGLLVYRFNRP